MVSVAPAAAQCFAYRTLSSIRSMLLEVYFIILAYGNLILKNMGRPNNLRIVGNTF